MQGGGRQVSQDTSYSKYAGARTFGCVTTIFAHAEIQLRGELDVRVCPNRPAIGLHRARVQTQGRIGASHASAASNWSISSRNTAPSACSNRIAVSAYARKKNCNIKKVNQLSRSSAIGEDAPRPRTGSRARPRVWGTSHRGTSLHRSRAPSPLHPPRPRRAGRARACPR